MPRYIAVVSGKGGVGKTTTAINIATSMNKHGKNTVLVDSNLSAPNVGLHLGLHEPKNTLNMVMKKEIDMRQAIHKHSSGLKLVPASLSIDELKVVDMDDFKEVIPSLGKHAEIVVLDSAAGLNKEALSVLEACDEVLIVTSPELSAVTDALRTVKVAEFLGKPVIGVVLNMMRNDKFEMAPAAVQEIIGYPVISQIPYHQDVRAALAKKQPVVHSHPRSKVSKEYEKLVSLILGEKYFSTAKQDTLMNYVMRKLGFI